MVDTLATALLSIKTSGQRQSVYDSDFIKMRLWRQRPKNLGNKTFSGHEEEGNVTFPSADVIFGSDEKIQKPGTVDTQVSYHHLSINPRLRDPSVKKRDVEITQKREVETHQKRFRDLEISPKLSETTFLEVTFYTPAKLLSPFVQDC